jgi:phosphatidylglycerophosphatase A
MMTLLKKIAVVFASGFGLGFSPVASGTTGALPGLLIVWLVAPAGIAVQAGVACVLSIIAIPVCSIAEKHFGKKDDGRIVADEYMTFPICMIGVPWNIWTVPIAFVISRILDVIKPPPARQIQAVRGGTGIVLDDVFSNIYALLLNHVAWYFLKGYVQ